MVDHMVVVVVPIGLAPIQDAIFRTKKILPFKKTLPFVIRATLPPMEVTRLSTIKEKTVGILLL